MASFNPMSSRSWRKNVMMESISAFFNKHQSTPPANPPPTRHTSDATEDSTDTALTVVDRSKEVCIEEKGLAIVPGQELVNTLRDPDGSLSSTSSPKEGDVAFQGKRDPFAGGVEGGVTYKTLKWWHAAVGMVAETISLGILGLAETLKTLGLIPGLVLLIGIGSMATYAGYVISQFKWAYPHVHSMGDGGEILFGRCGREIFGVGAAAFIVFIMGSHLVAGGHTLNVLTDQATCTITFIGVIAVVSFLLTLPRTLKNTTYLSAISFLSVIGAITIVMIDLGIKRPGLQAIDGQIFNKYTLMGDRTASFAARFNAVTTMMFAFAGHVAFFSFISELMNPKDFPKALAFLQISDITMYIVAAVVIYYFAGQGVKSPALDSASPVLRKVAWGVAIGTIIIAGVINGHIAVKYIYVRLLRNKKSDLLHQKSWKARGIWCGICLALWALAFLLAQAVPVFHSMLALTGALFASWFTFGLPGMFWCHMNLKVKKSGRLGFQIRLRTKWTWKKHLLLGVNVFLIVAGALTCVAGLYATVVDIRADSDMTGSFSCKDPQTEA